MRRDSALEAESRWAEHRTLTNMVSRNADQEIRRAYERAWRLKKSAQWKRDRHVVKVARRRKNVAAIFKYKSENPCCKCGESDPVCLEFHHISDNKEVDIASSTKWGLKRIMAEIAKCIVVCANCHRKIHWHERQAVAQLVERKLGELEAAGS